MSKVKYILIRTGQTVVLLWLVLTLLFFLIRLMPGDYTTHMVHAGANEQTIAATRERWGLNDPLYVQYFRYVENFLVLDLGESRQFQTPVWEHTGIQIFNTFILAAPAITFAYLLGAVIGTVTGTKRDSRFEKWTIPVLIFFGSFPSFFLAIMFILIFAAFLGWFPTSGMLSPETLTELEFPRRYLTVDFLHHYTLPFAAVVSRYLFLPSLIMRTSVLETKGQGFMFYHRMTGISKLTRYKQLVKHSSLPVITIYPVSMSRALGGLILIETVFNWPGIGYTLVQAVLARDLPVVQFVFFIVAAFVIISNFVVDIVYGIIDPRVSVEDPE